MKNLFKALGQFQQECPVIHKGTEGYNYSYADLPEIFKIVLPLLHKHGLVFTQMMEGTGLKTILFHVASGEQLEATAEIPQGVELNKMNQFQVAGSAITYYRRYALSAMLGIVTDKDTDASGQQSNNYRPASSPQEEEDPFAGEPEQDDIPFDFGDTDMQANIPKQLLVCHLCRGENIKLNENKKSSRSPDYFCECGASGWKNKDGINWRKRKDS